MSIPVSASSVSVSVVISVVVSFFLFLASAFWSLSFTRLFALKNLKLVSEQMCNLHYCPIEQTYIYTKVSRISRLNNEYSFANY